MMIISSKKRLMPNISKIGIELSTKASGLKDKGPIEEGKKEKRDEKGLVDFVESIEPIEFIVSIDFSLDLSSFLVPFLSKFVKGSLLELLKGSELFVTVFGG